MEAEGTRNELNEQHPMKGGDGLYSYANNFEIQRAASDATKQLINMAIAEKLDKEILLNSKTFRIADLGCSVGPNTFFAVQNIVEALESKYKQCQELNSQISEFLVLFNDHTTNDFNLLFTSLPQNRPYYAAGVPGSFYDRLFPKASLHFVHSSIAAILWLSGAPKEVMNKNSPDWNKGRIHYLNSGAQVVRAYKAQFVKDMEQFLQVRAQEIVYGGLMVLIISGIPNGTHHSQGLQCMTLDLLGSCLMGLVRKGIVSEEKVDSFNVPIYEMSPQELEAGVERNGCFSIETIEYIHHKRLDNHSHSVMNAKVFASHVRASLERIIKKHFGEDILDVLFDSFRKKIEENPSIFKSVKKVNFFVLLKRRAAN
ncbi:loganic acid O-methyltransferase-like isoform X1 [Ziziphus jujuba]|uniref:Loganic acid O-methyltransferase-like isoform X1 n=1 Tax=Ziziphus jujuba TaxID=326968 RepID=A0ABM3IK16_ZIZJJ|nr:loganic acid O-methyltransferase-like isoform X1 [Ziziphus jujuba]